MRGGSIFAGVECFFLSLFFYHFELFFEPIQFTFDSVWYHFGCLVLLFHIANLRLDFLHSLTVLDFGIAGGNPSCLVLLQLLAPLLAVIVVDILFVGHSEGLYVDTRFSKL
jgi:hypothetical protein